MKFFWVIIGVCVRSFLVLSVLAIVWFCFNPPFGPVTDQFFDADGKVALSHSWIFRPAQAVPEEIQQASGLYRASIGGHESFFRAHVSPAMAKEWGDQLHSLRSTELENGSNGKTVDGIRRGLSGFSQRKGSSAGVPAWWTPPNIEVRSTESMSWNGDHQSGNGHMTRSSFDEATCTLWIYDYSQQHDQLWSRGHAPSESEVGSVNGAANSFVP